MEGLHEVASWKSVFVLIIEKLDLFMPRLRNFWFLLDCRASV